MVPQGDLHRQNVPSPLVRVPHGPEGDGLVVKCFPRSPGLSKLIRLGNIVLLLCRHATTLLHRDICPIAVIAAICVLCSFIGNYVIVLVATVGEVVKVWILLLHLCRTLTRQLKYINSELKVKSKPKPVAGLDDLLHKFPVDPTVEHLEIPPVPVNRLPLAQLPLLRNIHLAYPVKEQHRKAFVAIFLTDRDEPVAGTCAITVSATCQLTLLGRLRL